MSIENPTLGTLVTLVTLGTLAHSSLTRISTTVEDSLQISSFLTNKANFGKAQMNVNPYYIKDYQIFIPLAGYKNKPNSNPIKPNSQKAKMNVNLYVIEDYRKNDTFAVQQNKPNSNPIQTQTKPILKRMNVNFCAAGYYENKPTFAANNPNLDINTAWSSAARIRLSAGQILGVYTTTLLQFSCAQ